MTRDSEERSPRESDQEILERLVAGELSSTDPSVVERCNDPLFRERLEALCRTQRILDAAGDEDRILIEGALQEPLAPAEERVLARTKGILLDVPDPALGLRVRRWLLGLGAAAAALAAVVWLTNRSSSSPNEVWMGPGAVTLVRPRGAGADLTRIEWRGDLPPGGEFRVVVLDPTSPSGSPPLLARSTRDNHWTLSPEELARLGDRIRVEVSAWGPDGRCLGVDSSFASR